MSDPRWPQRYTPYYPVAIETHFLQSATIQRLTLAAGSLSRAQSETWADLATGVACAIHPLTGREMLQLSKPTAEVSHQAFFAAAQDLKERDRITVGSVRYEVQAVMDAAGRGHHVEALLIERKET